MLAQRLIAPASSLLPHEESEFAVGFVVRHELMPGLAREGLEVLHRPRVGGDHLQHLSRAHVGERLLGAQDRQRAIEAARIEFLVEVHEVIMPHMTEEEARSAPAERSPAAGWLLTIAQLPIEDPAARMRVLRTLESLGAAVMREGVFLLPDTAANRQSLEALTDYITKIAGTANVLHVSAASPEQQEAF